MNNIKLQQQHAMDNAARAEDKAAKATQAEKITQKLDESGLLVDGPSPDQYDYTKAQIAPEGEGYNLPNVGIKGVQVAGRDISSGEQYQRRNDPDGFGDEGFRRAQQGYTNTKTGAPDSAYDAVVPLMAEHLQNGGDPQDWDAPYPDEMKQRAFETLQATASIASVAEQLEQAPPIPESQTRLDDSDPVTLDQWKENPEILTAAKLIAEFQGGEDIATAIGEGGVDESELAENLVEEMGALTSSFSKMAEVIYAIESGDMPPDTQQAYLYALSEYEKFTPWDVNNLQGFVTGMLNDAPGYIASGGVGMVVLKQAGKAGAVRLLMQKLMSSTAGKVIAGGAAASAAAATENAAFEGSNEVMMQDLSNSERDWQKVFDRSGSGAVAGAIFGGPFGMLLSQPGRRGVMNAYRAVANEMSNAGTKSKWASQRGSLGVPEKKVPTYNGLPSRRDDSGVRWADTNWDNFYSELEEAIAGENPLLGKKPQKASTLLSTIQGQARRGKIASYELKDSGLEDFLAKKGDDPISKDELEDYLWANRPRVNMALSDEATWAGRGSENFAMKDPDSLRRSAAITVFKDRFFDAKEKMLPVDLTEVTQKTQQYVEQFNDYLDWVQKANLIGDEVDEIDLPFMRKPPSVNMAFDERVSEHNQALWKWSKAKTDAVLAGEPFNEPVPMPAAKPQKAWEVTNKLTGETEVFTDAGAFESYRSNTAREYLKNMKDDQIVQMIYEHDKGQLLAPPRWGRAVGDRGSPTIVKGENANGYQEMRLFMPYDGFDNPDTVAMERFGETFDTLNATDKKRVERIIEYANVPENAFRDEVHYPLEFNRLAHVRTQELYDANGDSILGVNEIQSDLDYSLRQWSKQFKEDAKESPEAIMVRENADGTEIKPPSNQSHEGWIPMTINRVMQLAEKQGYNKVALPIDPEMIGNIQNWKEADLSEATAGVLKFYRTLEKMVTKDTRLKKTWGIKKIYRAPVRGEIGGADLPEMVIIEFDPKKAPGTKPIYGVAAVSGAEGATMLDEMQAAEGDE